MGGRKLGRGASSCGGRVRAADAGAVGGRAPLALPVLESADEARVGLDAGTLALDEVEGGVVGHVVGVYEVRDDHCGRARHALREGCGCAEADMDAEEEEGEGEKGKARRVRDAL